MPSKAPQRNTSQSSTTTRFLCSSTAACIAEVFTYPVDTTRVRLQVLKDRRSMFQMMQVTMAKEGATAFYAGFAPALTRQFVQCGANLAAYIPIRDALGADKDDSLLKKGLAGGMSGAFGQFIAIPADLVKTRMQADVKGALVGKPPTYTNAAQALRMTFAEKGLLGMWTGATPAVSRSAAIHSTGLASYDGLKTAAVKVFGMDPDSAVTHTCASAASGFIGAAVGTPFDVIKTRVMNSEGKASPLAIAMRTVREEGFRGMFKGFVPTLTRFGPWQIIWLSSFEQISVLVTGHSKI
eukprot:TRINITY_DN32066_c0_g1_i1.p2 TRINITY_DN32066_c0_g1~~TRINITY_DN32066_c0_g1_i1.p2  ORF type:complete len:296 (+),score=105.63 TRINITY_DN32066_c0_g1_i1:67-954(+)